MWWARGDLNPGPPPRQGWENGFDEGFRYAEGSSVNYRMENCLRITHRLIEGFSRWLSEEEGVSKVKTTLNDIWYGINTLKHGDYQVTEESALKKVQKRLYKKFPEFSFRNPGTT